MKPDPEDDPLLRLAQDLDEGRAVDWEGPRSADPALAADIDGLREIETLSAALAREPAPLDTAARTHAWLDPGSKLGRYPIEREAGRGGMGVVYLARDEVLDRPVALKLLPADVARSPERLTRFTREARLLASLNHPNVATIYGLEEDDRGLRFLALEWVPGESLAARLQRGGLPSQEALEVCGQIARGLAAAHERGVIHRDLKPGNVMLTPEGRVKVLDFGLARRGAAPGDLPEGPSEPGIKGTWGYVSPECLTREEDHRADVFAFGCVLYECLAGVAAFAGETVEAVRAALLERDPDLTRLPAETPPAIRRLIAACTVKDPERRLGSMAEALRTIEAALGQRTAVRSQTAAATPHRLPQETDAFVGRDAELGELSERLRRGARLVTLLGAGGMGKTRLAVRYGWRSLEEWSGGVWFCDLTDARDLAGVMGAVAAGLGVSLGQADPAAQLGHAIAGRASCVVVLDNAEQVVADVQAALAAWLVRASEARFVVTSRERLGLAQEQVHTLESFGADAGMELFVERARNVRPGFAPDRTDAEAVRDVVRLVDGIPLAIELAAARIRMMSPAQIVERMRERFRLLAGAGGGRHGTLRATIDGSWELLAPWEQHAFAQCAVFEGGFTLAAAEAVLETARWTEAPWAPDLVQSLVDRSLLRTRMPEGGPADAPREVRFGMYVSLQEYAREKLDAMETAPDDAGGVPARRAAEERHGRWYARHGGEAEIAALFLHGGTQRRRMLSRELDNLVSASRRAAARGDGATAVATCAAAWEVFQLRGPFGAGIELSAEILPALTDDQDRRRALTTLGVAEWRSGRLHEGQRHLETALALHRKLGDRRWEGAVLGFLGGLQGELRRIDEGRARLKSALAIHREVGDRRREGVDIGRLGVLDQEVGKLAEARVGHEAALGIAREMGDRILESQELGHLAAVHSEQGRSVEARAHWEQGLAIARELGNRRLEGIVLHNLGNLDAEQGRWAEARGHYESSLTIAREVGNRSFEGHTLSALGTLHLDQGRTEEARGSFEASLAIEREVGDRKFEGYLLGELGRLALALGRLDEAADMLARAEHVLRDIANRPELGKLLCIRAELERRSGRLAGAQATFDEAQELAAEAQVGPDSELGRQLAKVRKALAGES